ncbi:protein-disulfide isomerase [Brassicibacter mesophilus]
MKLNYKFEIVAKRQEILKYGVTKTPSLVINGVVVLEGKVPSILEMPDILLNAFKQAKEPPEVSK